MDTEVHKNRIAVFASGNGSNAENIIRYFKETDQNSEVSLVVCNKKDAYVLQRAENLGIPSLIITRAQLNDEEYFSRVLKEHGIDFIALAGFLLMIPSYLVTTFDKRMVNIHPSLLPKYGGKGMYGRHIHEAVVANGETETGITIHYVSDACDEGGIIFQKNVSVDKTDTPADVEAKIHELEKEHYPAVIAGLLATSGFVRGA